MPGGGGGVGAQGGVDLSYTNGSRVIINDGFYERLQDPDRPSYFLSDLNPNPATDQPSINPNDPLLKNVTIKIGPNGETGSLAWGIPSNMTVWWLKNNDWVQVSNESNFVANGNINLLVEGIGVGTGNITVSFTPRGGKTGTDQIRLTVYSPLDIDGSQANTLVSQIAAATSYNLSRDTKTGQVWVTGAFARSQISAWQDRFRSYFDLIWNNGDTSTVETSFGVTTINTGPATWFFGDYPSRQIDTDDVEAVRAVNPQIGSAILIHELVEEYYQQIKGQPYAVAPPNWRAGGAHTEGLKAEDAVAGGFTANAGRRENGTIGTEYGQGPGQIKIRFTQPAGSTTIANVYVGP